MAAIAPTNRPMFKAAIAKTANNDGFSKGFLFGAASLLLAFLLSFIIPYQKPIVRSSTGDNTGNPMVME